MNRLDVWKFALAAAVTFAALSAAQSVPSRSPSRQMPRSRCSTIGSTAWT